MASLRLVPKLRIEDYNMMMMMMIMMIIIIIIMSINMCCQRHHNVLENPTHNLQYARSIIIDRIIHNNRPNVLIFNKTIKETYSIDATVLNSHNLRSTVTEKFQKHTEVKQEHT